MSFASLLIPRSDACVSPLPPSRITLKGATIGGGSVAVYAPGDVPYVDAPLEVVALDGNGDGVTEALADGSYTCVYHPPVDNSLADAEPDTRMASPGGLASFTSQQSIVFEPFTSYVDNADFQAKWSTMENVERGMSMYGGALSNATLTTDGPGGKKVMKYNWPDAVAYDTYAETSMNWYDFSAVAWEDELWLRHVSKIGSTHPSGLFIPLVSYKFMLVHFAKEPIGGGGYLGDGRIGWYVSGYVSGDAGNINGYTDGPGLEGAYHSQNGVHPDGYGVMKDWRCWVYHLSGLKQATKTIRQYCDGYKMMERTWEDASWQARSAGGYLMLQLGANWNANFYPTHIDGGTAQGGSANTVILPAGASAVDDFYKGMAIELVSGPGSESRLGGHASNAWPPGTQGEAGVVTAYNGTTKVATIIRHPSNGEGGWMNGAPDNTTILNVCGTVKHPATRLHDEVSLHLKRPSLLLPAGY